MILLTIGILFLIAGLGLIVFAKAIHDPAIAAVLVGVIACVVGMGFSFASTAIYVEDNEGGLVIKKISGGELPSGRIVAANGENGPQAKILPPGWHFFYWPWVYDLEQVQNVDVPSGMVGVVKAHDGKPLPEGNIYAPAWESPEEMLDAEKFLAGNGYRGPQLTVLSPGQYRFNTRLFSIEIKPSITVKVGEVAVIKANAGPIYDKSDMVLVNGVPIVPNGYRGIWNVALTPNQYYMHPDAYEIIRVKTTNRIYSYTGPDATADSNGNEPNTDNSISVRTKDGFEFPVDVRASAKISAEDAPYVVALLANPDGDLDKNGFDVLEEVVVLPAVRTIFRNSAEQRGALEYVATRSDVEQSSSADFGKRLAIFKIKTDGLFVADIGLSKTPEGKELLKTQTQKEVAKQEQDTWREKKSAQVARAESVKAEKEADKEADKVEAKVSIEIATDKAKAAIEEAKGKAEAAKAGIEAVGGFENYLIMKVSEQIMSQWKGQLPQSIVIGGNGESLNMAVLSKMLKELSKPETTP